MHDKFYKALKVDFTFNSFSGLLDKLISSGYSFMRFDDYISGENIPVGKLIIMRHDVDRMPLNSLRIAEMKASKGIKGSFFFRTVPESFNEKIIGDIAKLGHEIGYHYEDMDLAYKALKLKSSGWKNPINEEDIIDEAYTSFRKNLEQMREVADIKTICMHGSPLSPFDNKAVWKKYNYRDSGIIGEPYFDLDWNEFGYLTDTGRRWNGSNVSIRDKVNSGYNLNFKTTREIINNAAGLPGKIMFTIHPERWNNNLLHWSKQYLLQNMKNLVKKFIVRK
jgi:hypothetical protein